MKNFNTTLNWIGAAFLLFFSGAASALEGRVFFENRCPVANEASQAQETLPIAAALAGKVAGALAGAAIDAIASKLSEEKQVTLVFHERKTNWYRGGDGKYLMDSNLVCLIVAVGDNFQTRGSSIEESDSPKKWPSEDNVKSDDYARLRRASEELAALGIMEPPAFYIEYRATVLDGGSVFALDPRFVFYPAFLGKNVWLGSDTRDLLVQIEFSEPGEQTAFAQTKLQIHGLEAGKLTTQRVIGSRAPWSKQPSTGNSGTSEARLVPFNIKAMFTETAKPGKLGSILASALTDERASIVSAAETKAKLAISESERQSARNSAAEAANTALSNYIAAYDAYDTAKKALDTAKTGGDSAAITKAQNLLTLAKSKLDNTLAIARAAFDAADIPFTPIPVT